MDLITLSPFRLWVQRLWIENREERLTYGEEPATLICYWTAHKWWIRHEYRLQERKNVKRQTATAV